MRYGIHCKRMVQPKTEFSWGWFLLFCLTFVGGILYVIYYLLLKRKQCPICGGKSFKWNEPKTV